MAKNRWVKTRVLDTDAKRVVFRFTDGEEIVWELNKCPADIYDHLALLGAWNKGGDSYAENTTGTLVEAKEKLRATRDAAYEGVWSRRGGQAGGWLAIALHRHTGDPLTRCVEKVQALSDVEKKKLMADPGIRLIKATMDLEKAQAALDAAEKTAEASVDTDIL